MIKLIISTSQQTAYTDSVKSWEGQTKMNKPRVFVDFHNADTEGRVRLNCNGTAADLARQKIVLRNGQSLIIYSEELEVDAVVHYSQEENLWTAMIDWNAIQEVEHLVPQIQPHISDRAST